MSMSRNNYLQQLVRNNNASLVTSDWLMGVARLRDEWRCASTMCGGQCVMIHGMTEQQLLSVDNSDNQLKVSIGAEKEKAYLTTQLEVRGYSTTCVDI